MKALGIIMVVAILASFLIIRNALHTQYTTYEVTPTPTAVVKRSSTPVPTATPSSSVLPATAQLKVDFASQAPLSNWDELHEDACEEASFIMVKHFIEGTPIASKAAFDTEIIDMVHWEESQGYGKSISLTELNTIVTTKYGIKTGQVTKNITALSIKREIAAGRPVILGMAGKLLDNPNFRNGGPNYHMLVVTGYDATGFITNDPGTRLGEKYHYDYAGFEAAIHDWNSTDILSGGKNMLVFM